MSPEDAERRIRELEEELARQKVATEMYKDAALDYVREHVPYVPMTDDEWRQLTTDTGGQPIREIIAEYEGLADESR
jgi:hypothetical protein